jgi:hypothetical protein
MYTLGHIQTLAICCNIPAYSNRFAGGKGVAVVFTVFCLLFMLIYPAVSFPTHITGCYMTPLDQVCMCVSACCNLHIEPILAHLPIRSTERLVDNGSQPVRHYACCLVLNLNRAAARSPRSQVITLLWCGRMLKSGHGLTYSVLKNIYCDSTRIFFYLATYMSTSLTPFCITAPATIPIFRKLGSTRFSC